MSKRTYKNNKNELPEVLKNRGSGVPDIPNPPPPLSSTHKVKSIRRFRYTTFPIQLGMQVFDAANLIQKHLDKHCEIGLRLSQIVQCNVSEAVLIFEEEY